MTSRLRCGIAATTMAAALAGGLITAAPASATTLTAHMTCTTPTRKTFQCDLTIAGGTLPYSTTWTGDGLEWFSYTDTYHAQGSCTFTSHWVEARVTDAGGQAVDTYGYYACTVEG